MELDKQLQRFSDQIERLLSDADSEKTTRRETNARIFNQLREIDILLRGTDGRDGLVGRVTSLETSHKEMKDRSYDTFNRWTSIISIVIAMAVAVFAFIKHQ